MGVSFAGFAQESNDASRLRMDQERAAWIAEASSRPIESLLGQVQKSGDDLDPVITVTTLGITREGPRPGAADRGFLRGFIDKTNGHVSAQIYVNEIRTAPIEYDYRSYSYSLNLGLRNGLVIPVNHKVRGCSKWGCTHYLDLAIPISIEDIKLSYLTCKTGEIGNPLRYRLYATTGEQQDALIPCNEVAAFSIQLAGMGAKFP